MRRSSRTSGQTGTEYMLLVSVVVVAVVAAAYQFVPIFSEGVDELGRDVQAILTTGQIGGQGLDRAAGGASPSNAGMGAGGGD